MRQGEMELGGVGYDALRRSGVGTFAVCEQPIDYSP